MIIRRIIRNPRHPSHLSQDPDSIFRTFLEQFVLVLSISKYHFVWLAPGSGRNTKLESKMMLLTSYVVTLIVNLSCCTIAMIVNFLCCNSKTNFLRRRCRRKVLTQSGGTTVKSCTNHIRMICTKMFCTASILRNISVRCDMDISCLYWKLESS